MSDAPITPSRPKPQPRDSYRHFSPIDTRWLDNDAYGHINNAVYYNFFDTAVNRWLIQAGVLNVQHGAVIGLVVETQCHYFAPLSFPQPIEAGLRVAHVGRSSVRYEVGLFAAGAATCAAAGHFVHVYVDRQQRRPVALPAAYLTLLSSIRSSP